MQTTRCMKSEPPRVVRTQIEAERPRAVDVREAEQRVAVGIAAARAASLPAPSPPETVPASHRPHRSLGAGLGYSRSSASREVCAPTCAVQPLLTSRAALLAALHARIVIRQSPAVFGSMVLGTTAVRGTTATKPAGFLLMYCCCSSFLSMLLLSSTPDHLLLSVTTFPIKALYYLHASSALMRSGTRKTTFLAASGEQRRSNYRLLSQHYCYIYISQ